jgi:hypothetical protein
MLAVGWPSTLQAGRPGSATTRAGARRGTPADRAPACDPRPLPGLPTRTAGELPPRRTRRRGGSPEAGGTTWGTRRGAFGSWRGGDGVSAVRSFKPFGSLLLPIGSSSTALSFRCDQLHRTGLTSLRASDRRLRGGRRFAKGGRLDSMSPWKRAPIHSTRQDSRSPACPLGPASRAPAADAGRFAPRTTSPCDTKPVHQRTEAPIVP